jgi:hypothetical protein
MACFWLLRDIKVRSTASAGALRASIWQQRARTVPFEHSILKTRSPETSLSGAKTFHGSRLMSRLAAPRTRWWCLLKVRRGGVWQVFPVLLHFALSSLMLVVCTAGFANHIVWLQRQTHSQKRAAGARAAVTLRCCRRSGGCLGNLLRLAVGSAEGVFYSFGRRHRCCCCEPLRPGPSEPGGACLRVGPRERAWRGDGTQSSMCPVR